MTINIMCDCTGIKSTQNVTLHALGRLSDKNYRLGDEILKSTMGQKGGVMFIMEHSLINHKIGALHARVHNGTKGWRHNGTSKGVP